jgi:hypothetical protein
LNVVKGSYGGAYAFNNEGKIVFLDNGQKPTDMSQALSHEATHSLDLNKTQVKDFNDNLKSEMTNLSDNEVIALQNIVKGITGSSIDEKMIRDGFVSKYAYGKGTQVENLTEFGSMMLHPDPSVRQAVGNMFPQSKETFYNWVSNAPRAEIDTAIRKVKPVKGELSKKIYTLKREVNGIENLLDRANAVESKISTLKEEAENLKRIIEPEHKEEFKAWFKEQYPNASTEITEVWTEFENKVVGHVSDSMTDNQRAAMDMVRKLFDEYGISEGQEMIENYVYHALNMDLRNNPVNTKLFNELHNPATPFELNRKHQGTIEKINKEMAEELGDKLNGKPFFETMISRIVAERGLKHNKFMFDKEIVDKSMSLFGTRIDKASYEGLEAEAKKAKFKEIQDMFYSGNYVVVRLDDKYREKLVNTVPSETLEGADINHAIEQIQGNNTPFILVDPKDIRPEKLFEKADQPVYLVPKDAYKSIQYQIHDQFVRSNNALLKLFDKFTNMFKAQAVFSTGFHLQNEIGNLFNSYLSIGANVLDPTLNTDAAMVQAGRAGFMDYSKEEFKKLLGEYGIVDNGFYGSEMKNFISGETDTILKSSGKTLKESLTPWNSNFMPWRANRAVGSTIENQAKLVNFMYHLKSGKSVQEAADLTHKFLFDYSDLTDFEEGFMKRIMPFYTWIRKNVPLQFEQMINSPQKYGRVYRFMNDMSSGESEEQRRFRPDYLRDATYIGDNKYANINIPYKDLGRLAPKELAGMLNPLIKVPMEVGMNKNIYFDSPIASYEGAKTKAPMYMYPIAESTPNGKFIDAKTRYILRNMFPIAEKTSKFAEGIQDDSEKTFNNILKPINTYNVDVDSEKQRAMYRYIEKLKAAEQSGKQAGHIAKDKPQA